MRVAKMLAAGCLLVGACAVGAQEKKPGELVRPDTGERIARPPVATPKVDAAALEKLGWKLGTQAYTFRHLSTFEAIDVAKQLGLQYVELYPGQKLTKDSPRGEQTHHTMSDENTEKLKAKLKEAGLVALNYGVVNAKNRMDETEWRQIFGWAKKVGIQTIVCEPPRTKLEEDRALFALLDKLAEEHDMTVAIHNHPEPNPYGTPEKALEVLEGRSKRVGVCADIGHYQRSGIKPVEAVAKLKGKILCMHVKDLNEFGKKNAHDVPWGTGVGEIKAVLEQLKKQGATGVKFSVENERAHPQLVEDVAKSVEFFSDTATELAK